MDRDYLKVGVITSTHGVHGEVKVYPTTDEPERFRDLKTVTLYLNGKEKQVTVDSVKFFKKQVILGFEEIKDMDSAYALRNSEIRIPRSEGIELGENEFFIGDIIGLTVIDESGKELGKVSDIITTAANDVYEVKRTDGSALMIPAIHDCILSVDTESGVIKVHLLPGLEDL
ncbi:MAG: 16S rRNA processing protein RimM [Lachnospiraceae bacterium]|uniref:Ribosome maturation factor RimM n=1 Tax=Candidatus Weimeria bifida TaxID=2599074 RepID=A0A6N7IWA8_9FIRM|nr:16S rRNA processing protein RimM [Candidatus Weimeria bifida]RRF96113.1 MAG: 16S rRNA processing protein RimM [Lachnospiraceae bacterium]